MMSDSPEDKAWRRLWVLTVLLSLGAGLGLGLVVGWLVF